MSIVNSQSISTNLKTINEDFDNKRMIEAYLTSEPFGWAPKLDGINLLADSIIVIKIGGYDSSPRSFLLYRGKSYPVLYNSDINYSQSLHEIFFDKNVGLSTLIAEDNKPVTDWQLATFQTDYDPNKNPWLT
ncbi:hypothetical protein CLV62_1124 [Dysgonomonas alginatilytica]|uniref:Uncharacterized protein n=1 Tax=Dysgonomonas alginatilytica TaxID=1605892 RepID=A0A2V3PN72_9BACT|nr:hypothetical protein [Dysgonomonas alginatilytica]PXV63755.1 hypothetical protein CLV62_1124 [Dysgonomonas alginatilytica]